MHLHLIVHRVPKHIKQKLTDIKDKIDNSIILVTDFHTPLSATDRTINQEISKDRLFAHSFTTLT